MGKRRVPGWAGTSLCKLIRTCLPFRLPFDTPSTTMSIDVTVKRNSCPCFDLSLSLGRCNYVREMILRNSCIYIRFIFGIGEERGFVYWKKKVGWEKFARWEMKIVNFSIRRWGRTCGSLIEELRIPFLTSQDRWKHKKFEMRWKIKFDNDTMYK